MLKFVGSLGNGGGEKCLTGCPQMVTGLGDNLARYLCVAECMGPVAIGDGQSLCPSTGTRGIIPEDHAESVRKAIEADELSHSSDPLRNPKLYDQSLDELMTTIHLLGIDEDRLSRWFVANVQSGYMDVMNAIGRCTEALKEGYISEKELEQVMSDTREAHTKILSEALSDIAKSLPILVTNLHLQDRTMQSIRTAARKMLASSDIDPRFLETASTFLWWALYDYTKLEILHKQGARGADIDALVGWSIRESSMVSGCTTRESLETYRLREHT